MNMTRKLTPLAIAAAALVGLLLAPVSYASIPWGGGAPEVTPQIAVPSATPRVPVAGMAFTVSHVVTVGDTGLLLTSGRMICDPSINGTALVHAESFTGGLAALHFMIPKNTQGKLLKVHVTIKLGDRTAVRDSYFRIQPAPAPWSYKPLP